MFGRQSRGREIVVALLDQEVKARVHGQCHRQVVPQIGPRDRPPLRTGSSMLPVPVMNATHDLVGLFATEVELVVHVAEKRRGKTPAPQLGRMDRSPCLHSED